MSIEDQPPPNPNERTPVWELVIADMRDRDTVGRERYGTPLQTFNGRDAIVDAYQEALDQVVYLRQAIEEDLERQRIAERAVNAGLDIVTVDHVAEALLNAHQRRPEGPWQRLSEYQDVYVRRLRIDAIVALTDRDQREAAEWLDSVIGVAPMPAPVVDSAP